MILVISQNYMEISTDQVLNWISYLGGNFIRINGDQICKSGGIRIVLNNSEEEFSLSGANKFCYFNKFNIAWYRRWINEANTNSRSYSVLGVKNSVDILNNIAANDLTLKRYFFYSIKVKKWLTEPSALQNANNKIIVLSIARKHNLLIPSTIICSRKVDLIGFMKRENKIITKDLTLPFSIEFSNEYYIHSYTAIFEWENLKSIPNNFLPTLFQQYLEKDFEIRSFFLDNIFYSMAIFSQKDDKTKIDFRNYNSLDPNRVMPFKLPNQIEEKLRKVFIDLNLETGSVDIIKHINGGFYFLEINPIGQFGMTSFPCNYNLEKKIAEYLIKNDC